MIAIDETFISGVISYFGDTFSGLKLFIILLIGLQIGFFILEELVSIVKYRLAMRRRLREEEEEREEKVIAGILKPYKIHREKALREIIKEELIEEA